MTFEGATHVPTVVGASLDVDLSSYVQDKCEAINCPLAQCSATLSHGLVKTVACDGMPLWRWPDDVSLEADATDGTSSRRMLWGGVYRATTYYSPSWASAHLQNYAWNKGTKRQAAPYRSHAYYALRPPPPSPSPPPPQPPRPPPPSPPRPTPPPWRGHTCERNGQITVC